jgi:peptidylprolyl isomerase
MTRKAAVKKDFVFVLIALGLLTVILTIRSQLNKPETVAKVNLPAPSSNTPSPQGKEIDKKDQKEITTPSGLKYTDLREGTGDKAEVGSRVTVKYVGTFKDGKEFDSGEYTLTIGRGEVIRGWEEGLQGMKPGGKRKLYIPYALAYGEAGRGKIPPKTDLYFDLEVKAVQNP